MDFKGPDDNTCTIKVSFPEKFRVRCEVNTGMPLTDEESFVAIGGPLNVRAVKPAPDASFFMNAREHPARAAYATWFLDRTQTPVSGLQTPQDAEASVAFSQPAGTTYEWSIGSLASNSPLDGASAPSEISVYGNGGGDSTVSCTFHYDDGEFSGTAQDDTAQTPFSASHTNYHLVNKVTVRVPNLIQTAASVYLDDAGFQQLTGLSPSTYSYNVKRYDMRLKDDQGDVMPGVWVQERFESLPPGIMANTSSFVWVPGSPPAFDPWANPSGYIVAPAGRGMFNFIGIWWPKSGPTPGTTTGIHRYWAGTRNVTPTTPDGVPLQRFQCTFSPTNSGQAQLP